MKKLIYMLKNKSELNRVWQKTHFCKSLNSSFSVSNMEFEDLQNPETAVFCQTSNRPQSKTNFLKFFVSFFAVILISTSFVNAQIIFTAFAPQEVKAGSPFNIVYEINAKNGKEFRKPSIANLRILRTSTSYSSNISVINGSVKEEYVGKIVLTAVIDKEGELIIPSASIKVNGKKYQSNKLSIKVRAGDVQTTTEVQNSRFKNRDIFLNFTTNKTEVYIGEPIYAYPKIFSRYNGNLVEFNPSNMADFWIQELPMPSSIKAEHTKINGITYLTAVLEKKLIFPQKTGNLEIKPYDATFQLYDGWGFPAGTKKVISNKKIIKVKPLPANKPKNFTGAVGQFDVSVSTDIEELEVDQAITIKLVISGIGNFGLFDNPELKMPKTFEELVPETKSKTKVTTQGIEGSKVYVYKYIARVPGDFTVNAVDFSYFDPQQEKYVTKRTKSLDIKVLGDTTLNGTKSVDYGTKEQATEVEKDIRFIKIDSLDLHPKDDMFFGKLWFWLAYLIPFVLFILAIIILQKRIRENANIDFVKSKKADKVSIKRLKIAYKYMNNNDLDRFYEEITKALWGYVSDKLSIPISELTRQTAAETLRKNNVDEKLINDFIKVIDLSETARYAQSGTGITPQTVYDEASSIITNFEKNIYFLKKKS